MNERTLRCPRCRARSPESAGKCLSCGLPMYTKRLRDRLGKDAPRPPHFLSGRFHRVRKETAPARLRTGAASSRDRDDFGGVALEAPPSTDLLPRRPRKEGVAPQASGKTSMYQLSDMRLAARQAAATPAETAPAPASGEPPPPRPPEPAKPARPKSGFDSLIERNDSDEKVEVGAMADFLMAPHDRVDDHHPPPRPSVGGEGMLELGPRFNEAQETGDREPEPPKADRAAAPESDLTAEMPRKREKEGPDFSGLDIIAREPAAAPRPEPERAPAIPLREEPFVPAARARANDDHHPWRSMMIWVAPQVLLLLVLISWGPSYIRQHYVVEGPYKAKFTDNEGRSITCTTTFQSSPDDRFKFNGLLECQLYANDSSIERVDEPRVLKPIMGGGKIPYTGRWNLRELNMTLGSIDEEQTRSAAVRAKFKPNVKRIVGTVSNPLGQAGDVELTAVNERD